MSELREFECRIYWQVEQGVDEANDIDLFYLKSEADKVIAELEDKALQYKVLDKEHCRDLITQEKFFANQIAHHKYKRCVAMAMMLEHICPITIRKAKWKGKWHLRWLELAEKFKEAK